LVCRNEERLVGSRKSYSQSSMDFSHPSEVVNRVIKTQALNCGWKGQYARDTNCPAKYIDCYNCHKEGHLSKFCRSRLSDKRKRDSSEDSPEPSNIGVRLVDKTKPENEIQKLHILHCCTYSRFSK